jgi:hypothetical protein
MIGWFTLKNAICVIRNSLGYFGREDDYTPCPNLQ